MAGTTNSAAACWPRPAACIALTSSMKRVSVSRGFAMGTRAVSRSPNCSSRRGWLAAFDLEIIGRTDHIGRDAYAVAGQPRQTGGEAGRRVSALVDAELGVLLRYEKSGPRGQAETAEFTSLKVDAAPTPVAGAPACRPQPRSSVVHRGGVPLAPLMPSYPSIYFK
jgi:hypothetical protein